MSESKRTVFYHHPCLDGSLAAWSAYAKYGDDAQYVGLDHADYKMIEQKIRKHISLDTIAMFVDFAPRRTILESIIDDVQGIEIYDHHVTAEKDLEPFMDHPKCEIYFDMDRSGAGMAFDYFQTDLTRPLFVDLVEKLDLYQPERFETPDQFYLVASYLSNIVVDTELKNVLPIFDDLAGQDDIGWFEKQGEAARTAYLKRIHQVLEHKAYLDLRFLKSSPECDSVVAVRTQMNEMGHEFSPHVVAASPSKQKVAMIWDYHDEETIKLSFRCDGQTDLSLLAEEIGRDHGLNGGGHKGAAAARLTTTQFEAFLLKAGTSFEKLKAQTYTQAA